MGAESEERPGYRKVITTYFTTKNGKRVTAASKGKKVFVFWVKDNGSK